MSKLKIVKIIVGILIFLVALIVLQYVPIWIQTLFDFSCVVFIIILLVLTNRSQKRHEANLKEIFAGIEKRRAEREK